jgi:hypothetical protein
VPLPAFLAPANLKLLAELPESKSHYIIDYEGPHVCLHIELEILPYLVLELLIYHCNLIIIENLMAMLSKQLRSSAQPFMATHRLMLSPYMVSQAAWMNRDQQQMLLQINTSQFFSAARSRG